MEVTPAALSLRGGVSNLTRGGQTCKLKALNLHKVGDGLTIDFEYYQCTGEVTMATLEVPLAKVPAGQPSAQMQAFFAAKCKKQAPKAKKTESTMSMVIKEQFVGNGTCKGDLKIAYPNKTAGTKPIATKAVCRQLCMSETTKHAGQPNAKGKCAGYAYHAASKECRIYQPSGIATDVTQIEGPKAGWACYNQTESQSSTALATTTQISAAQEQAELASLPKMIAKVLATGATVKTYSPKPQECAFSQFDWITLQDTVPVGGSLKTNPYTIKVSDAEWNSLLSLMNPPTTTTTAGATTTTTEAPTTTKAAANTTKEAATTKAAATTKEAPATTKAAATTTTKAAATTAKVRRRALISTAVSRQLASQAIPAFITIDHAAWSAVPVGAAISSDISPGMTTTTIPPPVATAAPAPVKECTVPEVLNAILTGVLVPTVTWGAVYAAQKTLGKQGGSHLGLLISCAFLAAAVTGFLLVSLLGIIFKPMCASSDHSLVLIRLAGGIASMTGCSLALYLLPSGQVGGAAEYRQYQVIEVDPDGKEKRRLPGIMESSAGGMGNFSTQLR
jgi:hypothetical protein